MDKPRRVRRTTLRGERTTYSPHDAATNVAAVWALSRLAWHIKEGRSDEPRLRRDVVRIVRGGLKLT